VAGEVRRDIDERFGSAVKFAERFSVPVRIHLTDQPTSAPVY
jgi:hypothetical protein